MLKHQFIFNPGIWLGEGTITLSVSPEKLRFYARWVIAKSALGVIHCQQRVEMVGREEDMFNQFEFSGFHFPENAIHKLHDISDDSTLWFSVKMTNELIGPIEGKGVVSTKKIAWEFRNSLECEGFEWYELQDNGEYKTRSEFISPDRDRTIVEGRIWQKSKD